MKKQTAVLLLVAAVVVVVLQGIATASSFRCGPHLIETGDGVEKLLSACGAPTFRVTARETTGADILYYDQGAAQFIMKVTIVGGQIIRIEQEERGIGSPAVPSN